LKRNNLIFYQFTEATHRVAVYFSFKEANECNIRLPASPQFLPPGLLTYSALRPACNYFTLPWVQILPFGLRENDSFRPAGKKYPREAGGNLLHVIRLQFLHFTGVQILHEILLRLFNDSSLL
jgi:hypothetical protein